MMHSDRSFERSSRQTRISGKRYDALIIGARTVGLSAAALPGQRKCVSCCRARFITRERVQHPMKSMAPDSISVRQRSLQILLGLRSYLTDFSVRPIQHIQCGTPLIFRTYTGRVEGLAGGIPIEKRVPPIRYPLPAPFPGLFCIGDTLFPGQCIPGVTLSALVIAAHKGAPSHEFTHQLI